MLLVIQTSVSFMWMACQPYYCHICEGSGQNEIVFLRKWKDGRGSQTMIKGHRQGQFWSWSCSHCTLHVLSLFHCLARCFTLSLSISFPSSHIFLSSSTYFIGGGGGCRYTTRSSVWETQSKTGTDPSRCTDHSGGLHHLTSPLCFILHLKFALCICWGLLSPHISPVSLFPLLNSNTCTL